MVCNNTLSFIKEMKKIWIWFLILLGITISWWYYLFSNQNNKQILTFEDLYSKGELFFNISSNILSWNITWEIHHQEKEKMFSFKWKVIPLSWQWISDFTLLYEQKSSQIGEYKKWKLITNLILTQDTSYWKPQKIERDQWTWNVKNKFYKNISTQLEGKYRSIPINFNKIKKSLKDIKNPFSGNKIKAEKIQYRCNIFSFQCKNSIILNNWENTGWKIIKQNEGIFERKINKKHWSINRYFPKQQWEIEMYQKKSWLNFSGKYNQILFSGNITNRQNTRFWNINYHQISNPNNFWKISFSFTILPQENPPLHFDPNQYTPLQKYLESLDIDF